MKTKDNKNFVILIKKFIWQYMSKYFVESTIFVFSVSNTAVYWHSVSVYNTPSTAFLKY